MFKTTSFLLLSLFTVACSSTEVRREPAPAAPEPTAAPSALATAHDAYLGGDYVATGEAIRDVLLDPSSGELAKENALELLDAAYEANNGNLPSRFALPAGFSGLQFGAQRGESKYGVNPSMHLWLRVKEGMGSHVDEMAVLRPDGSALFTKGGESTTLQIKPQIVPGTEDVVLNLKIADALPADGVYTIHVGIDGKRVIDTWFIARKLSASAVPSLSSPTELVNDANPFVRFTPFRSPEYSSFERRSLNVYIEDSTTHTTAWNFWTGTPGDLKEVRIDRALPTSSYWVSVTEQERRSFGPLEIERGSQFGAPFSVVR